jgi:hypothetical protein
MGLAVAVIGFLAVLFGIAIPVLVAVARRLEIIPGAGGEDSAQDVPDTRSLQRLAAFSQRRRA